MYGDRFLSPKLGFCRHNNGRQKPREVFYRNGFDGFTVNITSHNSSRKTSTPVLKSTRLLDQLREQTCCLHYSLSTEEAYVFWVKKFIYFHGKKCRLK